MYLVSVIVVIMTFDTFALEAIIIHNLLQIIHCE